MVVEWLIFAGGLIVVLVSLPYLLGPLLIYATMRYRVPAEVVVIDPTQEPLPEDVRAYFHETYQALSGLGFELVAVLGLPSLLPHIRTILALYRNDETLDLAMSTFMVATGKVSIRNQYVEFYRRYSDGVCILTNNTPQLGSFPPLPDNYIYQFWDIKDLDRLFALHRFLAAKHRRSGHAISRLDTDFNGDPVRFIAEGVLGETFAAQVPSGYIKPHPGGYRPTFKGAVIMTWQELWPAKMVRRTRRRGQAQEVQREFEASRRDFQS